MPFKIKVFRFIYSKFIIIYAFSVKYQNNGIIVFKVRCFFYSAGVALNFKSVSEINCIRIYFLVCVVTQTPDCFFQSGADLAVPNRRMLEVKGNSIYRSV